MQITEYLHIAKCDGIREKGPFHAVTFLQCNYKCVIATLFQPFSNIVLYQFYIHVIITLPRIILSLAVQPYAHTAIHTCIVGLMDFKHMHHYFHVCWKEKTEAKNGLNTQSESHILAESMTVEYSLIQCTNSLYRK